MKKSVRYFTGLIVLSSSLLTWPGSVSAEILDFFPIPTIDPPSAPLEVSGTANSYNLIPGVSGTFPLGQITLTDTTNSSGGTAVATIAYYEIVINNGLFILGDPNSGTGGIEQTATYSAQLNGDCTLTVTDSVPRMIELGDMYGPGTAATLTVTFLGTSILPQTCTGDPITASFLASFLLEITAADSDGDGIIDSDEILIGTNPNDDDSDDDGLLDGAEVDATCQSSAVPTNPLAADSDGDGLLDGLECGLIEPQGNDTDLLVFVADSDSLTTTDPTDDDSDEDGLLDGSEDSNSNGAVDAGETDPNNADSDGDGIQDGTESGLTAPQGNDTDPGIFVADADPLTVTDPNNDDTDADGLLDGEEDLNKNGRLDAGETDPLSPETPPPPPSPSCLDATSVLISYTQQYQQSNRELKRKCGQRLTDECLAVIQEQQQAFGLLSMQQETVGLVCYPQ